MKRASLAMLIALAGCDKPVAPVAAGPGAAIEASAAAAGMIADRTGAPLIGSWSRESDRMCAVPGDGGGYRVGLSVDYGDGQACVARGTARRHGDRLDVAIGDCRIAASVDGDRIALPPDLPSACDRLCSGRASLAAMTVDRQSESAADAAAVIAPDGLALCRN